MSEFLENRIPDNYLFEDSANLGPKLIITRMLPWKTDTKSSFLLWEKKRAI